MWPRLLGALTAPERFSGATHKEPSCFAAERGPDPFGHTRALRGPFFDSKSEGQGLGRLLGALMAPERFSGATGVHFLILSPRDRV